MLFSSSLQSFCFCKTVTESLIFNYYFIHLTAPVNSDRIQNSELPQYGIFKRHLKSLTAEAGTFKIQRTGNETVKCSLCNLHQRYMLWNDSYSMEENTICSSLPITTICKAPPSLTDIFFPVSLITIPFLRFRKTHMNVLWHHIILYAVIL